ncbi:uncharacterized protein LOC135092952 [Scylla paramamosain]|uniref:uncharacterized protein LOC135092952 n=1 Tax=Scylla paramamosain TaxID=85552 RepID=UPI0030826C2D
MEGNPEKVIRILRITEANQSLILSSVFPWSEETSTGREVSCKGAGGKFSIPLHKVWLDCGYITGEVTVGVKETLCCFSGVSSQVHPAAILRPPGQGDEVGYGRIFRQLPLRRCRRLQQQTPASRRSLDATPPPHRRSLAATPPPPRRSLAATPPPHRRCPAATPLAAAPSRPYASRPYAAPRCPAALTAPHPTALSSWPLPLASSLSQSRTLLHVTSAGPSSFLLLPGALPLASSRLRLQLFIGDYLRSIAQD